MKVLGTILCSLEGRGGGRKRWIPCRSLCQPSQGLCCRPPHFRKVQALLPHGSFCFKLREEIQPPLLSQQQHQQKQQL